MASIYQASSVLWRLLALHLILAKPAVNQRVLLYNPKVLLWVLVLGLLHRHLLAQTALQVLRQIILPIIISYQQAPMTAVHPALVQLDKCAVWLGLRNPLQIQFIWVRLLPGIAALSKDIGQWPIGLAIAIVCNGVAVTSIVITQ